MKIIRTDNYGRSGESPGCDEKTLAENVPKHWADVIVKLLKEDKMRHDSDWFKVEDDNYKPAVFEP